MSKLRPLLLFAALVLSSLLTPPRVKGQGCYGGTGGTYGPLTSAFCFANYTCFYDHCEADECGAVPRCGYLEGGQTYCVYELLCGFYPACYNLPCEE